MRVNVTRQLVSKKLERAIMKYQAMGATFSVMANESNEADVMVLIEGFKSKQDTVAMANNIKTILTRNQLNVSQTMYRKESRYVVELLVSGQSLLAEGISPWYDNGIADNASFRSEGEEKVKFMIDNIVNENVGDEVKNIRLNHLAQLNARMGWVVDSVFNDIVHESVTGAHDKNIEYTGCQDKNGIPKIKCLVKSIVNDDIAPALKEQRLEYLKALNAKHGWTTESNVTRLVDKALAEIDFVDMSPIEEKSTAKLFNWEKDGNAVHSFYGGWVDGKRGKTQRYSVLLTPNKDGKGLVINWADAVTRKKGHLGAANKIDAEKVIRRELGKMESVEAILARRDGNLTTERRHVKRTKTSR